MKTRMPNSVRGADRRPSGGRVSLVASDRDTSSGDRLQKGATMSDQADSLRQLVRAQRQWREIDLQKQAVTVSRSSLRDGASFDCGNQDRQSRNRRAGIGGFVARAAWWALTRAGMAGK